MSKKRVLGLAALGAAAVAGLIYLGKKYMDEMDDCGYDCECGDCLCKDCEMYDRPEPAATEEKPAETAEPEKKPDIEDVVAQVAGSDGGKAEAEDAE